MVSAFEYEIVGIFNVNFEFSMPDPHNYEEFAERATEFWGVGVQNLPEDIIFSDVYSSRWSRHFVQEQRGLPPRELEYSKCTFFIDDPALLDETMSEVRESEDLDSAYWKLLPDDTAYKASEKPLTVLNGLSTALIVISLIGALTTLLLIMNIWVRSRDREIRIYLSIGKTKPEIILQFILESLITAVIGAVLAVILCALLLKPVGTLANRAVSPNEGGEGYSLELNIYRLPEIEKVSADPVDLSYELTGRNILLAAAGTVLCAVASTAVCAARVVHKPVNRVMRY